jgi:hypothetical protein
MRRISALLATALLALVGCATNKPLEAQRIASVPSIEVVRLATPEIQRHSPETIMAGGLIFGGFGMEAAGAAAGKALRERCTLEDLGYLVLREFVDQAPKRIPNWPSMSVQEAPVEAGFVIKDSYLLRIQPAMVWIYTFGPKGLMVSLAANLSSPAGEEIWRYTASYSQSEAGRSREIEELEAESCKLLKEEMQHAARALADQFVADLRGQER